MSLADPRPVFTPLAQLPPNALRRLRRRSSCPSIPRSVSICSFNSSSEDFSYPGGFGELDTYMSPLFRGLAESEEASREAAEGESDTPTEGSTPRTEVIHYDDSLFETLSNYSFDLTGHEHAPESPEASEGDPEEQSLTPGHFDSPLVPNESSNPEAFQHLPQTYSSLAVERPPSPPPVPPRKPRPMMPPNTGTRPLQITRTKKRQESSTAPQPLPRTDVQHERPPLKSILRTTTQVDLRGTYRGASPLAERKVHPRGIAPAVPVLPSSLRTHHPKVPSASAAEVHIPVATLFPTGLIPLERAQDKFKHAHCLEQLPPQPDLTDPSTSPLGDYSQRLRNWSLSRRFKKQRA